MERFFMFGDKNTWLDWNLILTNKEITPPEVKTNYVEIDGVSGSIDLTEALTGEIRYKDRTISASFFTNHGRRKDRVDLMREIRCYLHGRKFEIIEPDDPDHYFIGRAFVKSEINNLAYSEITIELICEPWRYSVHETERIIDFSVFDSTDLVLNNNGVKTVCPEIIINGYMTLVLNNQTYTISNGTYKISDFKLYRGVNVIKISGYGTTTFKYREADI